MPRSLRALAAALLLAAVALPAAATSPDGRDRRVRITNETSFALVQFYGSRVSSESWEENMLKGKRLEAGESAIFNFNDGSGACLFDFKAVFSDGDTSTAAKIDVCKTEDFFLRE